MSDNVAYTPGSGVDVAADDIGGVLYQRVKLVHGADGVSAGDVASGNPLPVSGRASTTAAVTLQTIAAGGSATAASSVACPGAGTIQATVSGTGAVSATVAIQVSNDNSNWVTLGTITLSGTTSATDGFAFSAPWVYIRSNCTAISGSHAALSVVMGA